MEAPVSRIASHGWMMLVCALAWAGCRTSNGAQPQPEQAETGTGGAGRVEQAPHEQAQARPRAVPPAPETQQLLKRIEGYRAWRRFPANWEPRLSEGHGGVYVVAYHNDVVAQAMRDGRVPLPDGALIVKENRMQPRAPPAALTIMSKQGGEWYWVKATPSGQVFLDERGQRIAGKNVEACEACHEARAANDYVFTHDFQGTSR